MDRSLLLRERELAAVHSREAALGFDQKIAAVERRMTLEELAAEELEEDGEDADDFEVMGAGRAKSAPFHFEVKATNDLARTFEGQLAAYTLDQGGDVIVPGAFAGTLQSWDKGKGRVIPLLDSHNRDSVRRVVGKLLDAQEVADGLWTKWAVIDGADGDEIYRRIKGGYVDGMSIGYRAVSWRPPTPEEARTGVGRFLEEIQLVEGSLVIEPMNADARVDLSTVKRDGERMLAPDDPRRLLLEERFREIELAGLGIET